MISEIKLHNFRVFDDYSIKVENPLVIFSGPNATGKSSVLEAIYLCSTSKSHRTNDLETLIKHDSDFTTCEIVSNKRIKMVISHEGKSLFINKSEIKKMSDFIGNINVVMFSPSDLELVTGGKAEKRHFLDLEISILDKSYLKYSSMYKKALKERNEALKVANPDLVYLDIITKELSEYALEIYQKRIQFIDCLNSELKVVCRNMNVEDISITYNKTYGDNIYESFKSKEKLDLYNRVTNIGPHRDDFTININSLDASEYASEGQMRTIIIAIKLALKEYISKITGNEPVLLLDDVFAALDKKRIQNLTKYVNLSKQTFITTTSILEIPDELLKNALVIRMDSKK